MSSWPLVSDFQKMLQNPKSAFRDPELQQCTVELDQSGQPLPRSGNFATVYRGFRPDAKSFAIRVFNRRGDERRERYELVDKWLGARNLASLVRFDYDERGIRATDGKLYPLVTMDWVDGVSLFDWARKCCRDGDQAGLRTGAESWAALVRELAENEIAHGDLQHGNILVTDGQFKLVDYDCLAVPDLMNRRNLETGLPPYQHPDRNEHTKLCRGLDNFSAFFIYAAIRALAANPKLWLLYVDPPNYDKLLFRAEDLKTPDRSLLHRDLLQSADLDVRWLAARLVEFFRRPIGETPSLDEALGELRHEQLSHELRTAIANEQTLRITQLAAEPKLQVHRLEKPLLDKIQAAQRRADLADQLVDTVKQLETDPFQAEPEFKRLFDARLIREFADRFQPISDLLVQRTKELILPRETLGLAASDVGEALVADGAGVVRGLWQWPEARFTDECILAACPETTGEFPRRLLGPSANGEAASHNARPLRVDLARRLKKASYEAEQHGHAIHGTRRCRKWHVLVWAIVDLGFTKLPSEPLVLGQIR